MVGPLHQILTIAFYVLWALIMVNVVLSWIPTAQWHPLGRFLLAITEPLLKPFRRLIPTIKVSDSIGLDLTPIIVIVIAFIVYRVVFALIPLKL